MEQRMNETRRLTIPYSRKKLLLLLVGAVLLTLGSLWLATLDDEVIRGMQRFNSPLLMHSLGVVGVVFFGACAVFAGFKLFDRTPGLILDERGFTHRAGMVAFGFVPWTDVAGVDVYEIQRQKLLVVKLVAPLRYVERGNALQRALNRSNHRMCGSPITLSANALAIDFDELRRLFWDYLSRPRDDARGR